jgi:hypothetical protein
MPKAAVDEKRQPLLAEYEIWSAENLLISPPSCDFALPQKAGKGKLSIPIPTSADARHDLGALRFGENIGHFN